MSPGQKRAFMAACAVVALVAFAGLYGYVMYRVWAGTSPSKDDSPLVYFATTLAGLVGGVVAMQFNEKLPDAKNPGPMTRAALPGATPSATGRLPAARALAGMFKFPPAKDWLGIIVTAYVWVYFAVGLAAAVTWRGGHGPDPELLRNLGLVTFGLFIAIARKFFEVPPA